MFNPEQIRAELSPFPSAVPDRPGIKAYLKYYLGECSAPPFDHHIGIFQSSGYDICAQRFIPKTPIQGHVILIHGLYTHTMANAPFICDLLRAGYQVFAYDLPGHGLTSGARTNVRDFKEYEVIFSDFLEMALPLRQDNSIFSIIAHSAGAAGPMDYLNQRKEIMVHSMILLAPLLRISYFRLAKFGFFLLRWFKKGLISNPKHSSATDHFIHRMQHDPLHNRYTPFTWLKAYFRWEKQSAKKFLHQPVVLLQGQRDTTVDWHYDDAWFQKHSHNLQEFYFPTAHHHPLNEVPAVYREVLKVILDTLNQNNT